MDFEVLGPVRVRGSALPVTAPMTRGLLAVLLARANVAVSVNLLVESLWPHGGGRDAPKRLQVQVHKLRRALGDHERLGFGPGGYVLRVFPGESDSERFEALLSEADEAAERGEPSRATGLLRKALDLWRGEPFADLPDMAALRQETERLVELRLVACEALYTAELHCGRAAAVVPELTDLAGRHPLRERLQGLLMTALYRAGRQSEALEVYRRTRQALVEGLGLEPGPELRRLQEGILVGEDHGPAARPMFAVPAQLPADISDFTGRAEAVDRLRGLLDLGRSATAMGLTTVTGQAGVGKTTLAVHVAHQRRHEFVDGQLYVDLRGADPAPLESDTVLAQFLRALGVDGAAIPNSRDERAALYRSILAGRRILVLLDNAASESQVRPLLPGTPECAVLVTSRARLTGLDGASRLDLDVLDPDQAVTLLARITGRSRVAAEPEAASEITRLCGYLPLAVRIAGARLAARAHWPLRRLAGLLDDEYRRLDELRLGDLAVRASIDLSYAALDPPTRQTLRLLGLLDAPDVASWIVAALLDSAMPEAERTIDALLDAHLLEPAGIDGTGEQRYRFHDLVHVYARELAYREDTETDRRLALRRALGAWLGLGGMAHRRQFGGEYWILQGTATRWALDQPAADRVTANPRVWFEAERPALVAAIRLAAAEGWDELGWELATTCVHLFDLLCFYDDWKETHERALAAVRAASNPRGEAAVLVELAALGQRQGRYDEARRLARAAHDLFSQVGERRGAALALKELGTLERVTGGYDSALAHLHEALPLLREAGDPVVEAYVLRNIGQVHLERGDLESARDHLDRALERCRGTSDVRGLVQITFRVGELELAAGNLDLAEQAFRKSLDLAGQLGHRVGEAYALCGLGELHLRQGRLVQAERALADTRRRNLELAEPFIEARILLGFGQLRHAGALPAEAIAYLREGLDLTRRLGLPIWQARMHAARGDVHHDSGDDTQTTDAWREALELYTRIGSSEGEQVATKLRSQLVPTAPPPERS